MASRRVHDPTIPSTIERAPGSMPGIFGRPWNTSRMHAGIVGDLAFEVGRALGGLHPQRPDPAGDPDAVAPGHFADGYGPDRPTSKLSIHARATHRLAAACVVLRVWPHLAPLRGFEVERNDRRGHMSDRADRVGDAVGGAIVQHPRKPRVERATRKEHRALRLSVGDNIGDVLERRSFQAAVPALHDVERQVCKALPAPFVLELFGGDGIDVEMHRAHFVRPQRARVLDRSRRGHVELTDEHKNDVTLQDRRFGGRSRPGLQLLLLRHVLPVQPDQSVVHRWPDHDHDPGALENLVIIRIPTTATENAPAEPVDHRAEPPPPGAVGQMMLEHAEPGKENPVKTPIA